MLNYRVYLNALFLFELPSEFQGTEHLLRVAEGLNYREYCSYN